MKTGTLYFAADEWWAEFEPGCLDDSGLCDVAIGHGRTRDQATLAAMKNAETDFGWHGAVKFEEQKP